MFCAIPVKVLELNYKKIFFRNFFLYFVLGVSPRDQLIVCQKLILLKLKEKDENIK